MRKFLSVILFFVLTAPAIADECPMGYTPTKYTQLEYIESTGTQYIDTGIKPLSDYSFKADYMFTGTTEIGYQTFFGFYNGGTKNYGVLFGPELYAYSGNSITEQSSIVQNKKFSVHYDGINKHLTTTNGDYIDFSSVALGFSDEIPVSMKLFDLTYTVGLWDYPFKGKLYYLTVYGGNNNVVVNFIPAKRNNDGEIGMYDTVTGHFFTNAGTGEFIAGPETLMVITENTCFPCPPNTYKDFVGNGDCTPCPDTFSSPSGATSINECGRILHIGDYVAHMPFGRRTEHGLCTMFDGKKYCADVYERQ